MVFAGAGIPGGRVLGATDKTATGVTDLPVEPEDLLRTLTFGLDGTPMPSFEMGTDGVQRWDLIAFILSLRTR